MLPKKAPSVRVCVTFRVFVRKKVTLKKPNTKRLSEHGQEEKKVADIESSATAVDIGKKTIFQYC